MADETIECRRCGETKAPLPRAPFRNDLGERVLGAICQDCWKEWLEHQTLLINHYGLDPRDKKAKAFLYEQIERVLLEGGEGEDVDTSKEGSIQW